MREIYNLFQAIKNDFSLTVSDKKECERLLNLLDEKGSFISNASIIGVFYKVVLAYIKSPQWIWRYGQQLNANDIGFLYLPISTAKTVRHAIEILEELNKGELPVNVTMIEQKRSGLSGFSFALADEFLDSIIFHSNIVVAFTLKYLLEVFSISAHEVSIVAPDSVVRSGLADKTLNIQRSPLHAEVKLLFPSHYLDKKNNKYNKDLNDQTIHLCRQRKSLISPEASFSSQIRYLLNCPSSQVNSLGSAAKEMCMSTRNVRKKLELESTNFTEIQKNYKLERSIYMLNNSSLTVEEISSALGFNCASNFCRAFKGSQGVSPSEFRKGFILGDQAGF